MDQAAAGNLADAAHRGLDSAGGADKELIALAKRCLAADALDRPGPMRG